MKEFTLRELCGLCGVSRRAVQGYEKLGLVCPCGKTDRGYLLYDEQACDRVRYVKSLQNYGFSVREIVRFEALSARERTAVLREKLVGLEARRNDIEGYILELREMLDTPEGSPT